MARKMCESTTGQARAVLTLPEHIERGDCVRFEDRCVLKQVAVDGREPRLDFGGDPRLKRLNIGVVYLGWDAQCVQSREAM
jgi:hypothetical protein